MLDEDYLNKIRKTKNSESNEKFKLLEQCNDMLATMKDFITQMKNIEIASVLISLKRWISTKGKNNKIRFKRGDIVEVDLGLGYGYEMSYLHPCIVLDDSEAGFCFVIPCSTGKYGKKNKFIIDGYINDGFKNNTGVLLDSIRCISKTRINKKVGAVTLEFYDKIIEKLLNQYFKKHILNYNNLKKDYNRLLEENINLKKKYNEPLEVDELKNRS